MMTKKIKIIHLGNIAGVPGSLSKMLNKYYPDKVKSKFIARKNQDYYGFNEYYKESGKGTLIGGDRAVWYYLYLSFYILLRKPDVIQIHAWLKGLKMVSFLRKFYILKKPIIIYHGHGSDIRFKTIMDLPILKEADKIIVSTKDIMIGHSKYIPNPIDRELFFNPNYDVDMNDSMLNQKERDGKALYIRNFLPVVYPYDFMDKVKMFCSQNKLELTVLNRMSDHDPNEPYPYALTQGDFIPFKDIGEYYRQFEYFLDFKGVEPNLSKAGIEAGKSGCKVVHESFKVYNPSEINKYDGYNKFLLFYKEILEELRLR